MASRLEDYALLGNCEGSALVARDGSVDWLCLPRFDSGACFAALLGTPEHGRWRIAPADPSVQVSRRYLPDTLVLETTFTSADGEVQLLDALPVGTAAPTLVRQVRGVRGQVVMDLELVIRFDYGSVTPWVRRTPGGILAVAGPESLRLHAPVPVFGEDFRTRARFGVEAGQQLPFTLTWQPSHVEAAPPLDVPAALDRTVSWWRDWAGQCTHRGEHCGLVRRSLITLKALTYAPTGGMVAAPTLGLPEQLGGVRNWDYRYCWLRDAAFTLVALLDAGYQGEARAWREWLLRAVAGKPNEMHILYGVAGERRVPEVELDWLPGYEGAVPVRSGNAAHRQRQLDVFGELMDALHLSHQSGLKPQDDSWRVQRALLDFLETAWRHPDEGIWEIRGQPRHFTHSKVMAWVAMDRAVKGVEHFALEGPVERWRAVRHAIHADVCAHGYNAARGSFVQAYGSTELDASLLQIPLVRFLPPTDARVRGTLAAIEKDLRVDGLVMRYRPECGVDGLPGGEGAFLACSFWLVDNLVLQGRTQEACALFRRLASLANDVGLLAEEYDLHAQRMVGNFPQAFSHVALVNAATSLLGQVGRHRRAA